MLYNTPLNIDVKSFITVQAHELQSLIVNSYIMTLKISEVQKLSILALLNIEGFIITIYQDSSAIRAASEGQTMGYQTQFIFRYSIINLLCTKGPKVTLVFY